jgi:hypothetical protein
MVFCNGLFNARNYEKPVFILQCQNLEHSGLPPPRGIPVRIPTIPHTKQGFLRIKEIERGGGEEVSLKGFSILF